MFEFTGGGAVVTGAGSGLGRAMALAFAREGMDVVVSDIEADAARAVAKEIRAQGASAIDVRTDVADRAQVHELASLAVDAFGPVRLLCNNAGVAARRRTLVATHEDWQWVVGVNLWGVIHGIEAFVPNMVESDVPCHVVITSSMNGLVPSRHGAIYPTTKFALQGLSETLRDELAETRVGVSVLCPGRVRTRIAESDRNRPAALVSSLDQPAHAPLAGSAPLSLVLEPEMVAEMVVDGVREGQAFIFTDPDLRQLVQDRHDRMLGDFDRLDRWLAAR